MLNIAIRAVRQAAKVVVRAAIDLESLGKRNTQRNQLLEKIWYAAQEYMRETICAAYPEHAVLLVSPTGSLHPKEATDETQPSPDAAQNTSSPNDPALKNAFQPPSQTQKSSIGKRSSSRSAPQEDAPTWLIHAIDGLLNFSVGFPHYALSLTLKQDAGAVRAVLYDPLRDELFYAAKGRGAFLNDRRLRIEPRLKLSDTVIGLDRNLPRNIEALLGQSTRDTRKTGAFNLDLAYVACNRLDAVVGCALAHTIAGQLILTEAGGLIADWDAQNTNPPGAYAGVIAGDTYLSQPLLALIREANGVDSAQEKVSNPR